MVGRTGLSKDQRWISLFETVPKLCRWNRTAALIPGAAGRAENSSCKTPRSIQEVDELVKSALCVTISIGHF